MVNRLPRKPRSHVKRKKAVAKLANEAKCRIIVLGIGGAGNKTVNKMIEKGLSGSECVAINTDFRDLDSVHTTRKVLIGESVTRGLSAEGNPRVGRAAAEESRVHIESLLENADVAFVVAGLGGGTGSGAAPMVAEIAHRRGAVVVGVVTTPLRTETDRIEMATRALNEMTNVCDTIVLIDNNKFVELAPRLSMADVFSLADQTMANLIEGIVESISLPNLVNLNLADFRSIIGKGGVGIVGVGKSAAPVPNRAEEAVRSALGSPLFDADYAEAKGALIHVSGGPSMTVDEANHVGQIVSNMIGHGAHVSWGANVDPSFEDGLKVTIVMTGMRSPRLLSGVESMASKLYDIESSFSSREKPLRIDLGLDQIENFEG